MSEPSVADAQPSLGERLQNVTEALAAARSQQDVFDVVLRPALASLNAVAGAVLLVNDEGDRLEIAATRGYEAGAQTIWQGGPLSGNVPAGDALEKREALFFEHTGELTRAYPELEKRTGAVAPVSNAVLPIFLDERPLGVIVLDFKEPHHFTREEKRFLLTLSAQCAIALGRARLTANLERQVRERTEQIEEEARAQKAFVAFTEAVGSETDVMTLARQAIELLRARFRNATIVYYTRDGELWKARAWSEDISGTLIASLTAGLPMSTPLIRQALSAKTAVFTEAWDPAREQIEHSGEYGTAAYPLSVNGEVNHLLLFGLKDTGRWSERDKALVRAVGRGLELAFERAEQARRLEAQNAELDARTKALEGFANLTRDLGTLTDHAALIKRAQEVVMSLLPDGYALYFEPEGERWALRCQTGDLRSEALQAAANAGLPYDEAGNLLIAYTTRAPYYQDQYARDTDNLNGMVAHLGASATLPVIVNGQPRGVFAVALFGGVRHWTRPDQAVMESVVRSLGLALERAETLRELDRTRHYLSVVAENAPILLFATDARGVFTLSEGRLLNKLDLKSGEAVGHSATAMFKHEPDLREGTRLNRALAGEAAHDLMRFDSRGVVFETWFVPVKNAAGEVSEVVGVSLDVTERLEGQRAVERANEELRRSNAELEQFAYVASHDLQAPIRAVTSFADVIARRYGEVLDERGQAYLKQIVQSGQHMKRLVDDLLMFSRLHTEQRPLQPVDSAQVLDAVARRLKPEIEAAGGKVTRGELPTVLADPAQLDQLLQNLISNGLKYRREGVPPEVHVSAQRDGDLWRFAVSDNGIGIEAQYFERIFVIFQRLHSREQFEGTGIGLAVCKKIVERHGGQLWLESRPGQGSTFFFTLPGA